jgi:hypothetical protein
MQTPIPYEIKLLPYMHAVNSRMIIIRSLQHQLADRAHFSPASAQLMALPVPIVQGPPVKDAADELATKDKPEGKAAPAFWSSTTEEHLINEWGAEYCRINQGNLAKKHWEKITSEVNEKLPEEQVPYSMKQVRTKLDGLKAKFKEESKKKQASGM